MIHVSDISWTRKINHPSECLQKGQEVEAVVLDVNPKEQRISLGLKQAQQDPWDEIAKKFPVGSVVKGKVSKIASFGASVKLSYTYQDPMTGEECSGSVAVAEYIRNHVTMTCFHKIME